jgi:hypothetical protein
LEQIDRQCVPAPQVGQWEVVVASQFMAEAHRERARQCVCMAREMADSASRALLLEMAQLWMKLAHALERPDDKSGDETAKGTTPET